MSVSADDGETVDIYEKKQQRSRKQRDCDACELPILPGHSYVRESTLYDGAWEHVIRCARCDLIFEHVNNLCQSEGEWADRELNCGHEYEERWGVKPPEWLAKLAFWLPGDPLPATNPCTQFSTWRSPAKWLAEGCSRNVVRWDNDWQIGDPKRGQCERRGDPGCTAVCS